MIRDTLSAHWPGELPQTDKVSFLEAQRCFIYIYQQIMPR